MHSLSDPSVVVRELEKTYLVTKTGNEISLLPKKKRREVRALRGISFVARSGESIGILGRNGSGKTTLLNLIAGNEKPTSGDIKIAATPSLLSVGAALQGSLTGRQNVKLGLLAQGVSPNAVTALEDEVGEWAQIGDALDRPLSTYSSGMKARLKFSIATALKPEILLVDEALATGDAAFAARAKERMDSFLDESGTVFIVSHSAAAVRTHCRRAIWINSGRIVADGPVDEVAPQYADWGKLMAAEKYELAETYIANVEFDYLKPRIIYTSEVNSD